jgi:hypothetical protein
MPVSALTDKGGLIFYANAQGVKTVVCSLRPALGVRRQGVKNCKHGVHCNRQNRDRMSSEAGDAAWSFVRNSGRKKTATIGLVSAGIYRTTGKKFREFGFVVFFKKEELHRTADAAVAGEKQGLANAFDPPLQKIKRSAPFRYARCAPFVAASFGITTALRCRGLTHSVSQRWAADYFSLRVNGSSQLILPPPVVCWQPAGHLPTTCSYKRRLAMPGC